VRARALARWRAGAHIVRGESASGPLRVKRP